MDEGPQNVRQFAGALETVLGAFFQTTGNDPIERRRPLLSRLAESGRLFVEEVVTECRKRGATRVDVLAFEFEMGLFPASLDEAKQKGIDLAPKTIPPEVFDRRAVEKGRVRFYDVAYIEVTPRFGRSAAVPAASSGGARRTKDHGAGRSVNSQARTPALQPTT